MSVLAARNVTWALSNCWRRYLVLLERHPGRIHALNTCLLMGSGDVIAQVLIEKRRWSRDYDFRRTARFLGVGLLLAGPAMHVWYRALDRQFRGVGMRPAAHKMLVDQALFLPVYLAVFVSVMGALRGDTPADIGALLRRDMAAMLQTSYAVWPAVQLVNFRFVPLRHRILVINVVCLFWNAYIGWTAERQLEHCVDNDAQLASHCRTVA